MGGFIKSKLYVPVEDVSLDKVQEHYTIKLYQNDSICDKCQVRREGESDEKCLTCGNYQGDLELWSKTKIDGKDFYALPVGNLEKIHEDLGISFLGYKDMRAKPKFDYPIEWTGKLREGEIVDDAPSANQVKVTSQWLVKKYGFIESPARTGKTIMATFIACQIGFKTLIIAHKSDLLVNFYNAFEKCTNIKQLEQDTGKTLIKIIEDKKDFDNPDLQIALFTYQKFIRNTAQEDITKYLRDKYGFIVVDEAHQAGACAYASFLGKINPRHRLGLSATPLRKDSLNQVLLNLIGPTTAKSQTVGLIPKIEIFETSVSLGDFSLWAYFIKAFEQSELRLKIMLREIENDLKKYNCIIIPVDGVAYMKRIVNEVNKKFGYEIATEFCGKTKDRTKVLKDVDNGNYRVVVAIKSMIKQGIDLKMPDMIYIQSPMSAKDRTIGAPMFYQTGYRVATPYKNKQQPVIKIFVDNCPQSYYCFSSIFLKEIVPNLKGKEEGERPRYIISSEAKKRGYAILKETKGSMYRPSQPFNADYPNK